MKQLLTPEDLNFLEEKVKASSEGPWSIVEDKNVDTAWVVPCGGGNPIALFDYRSGEQNRADARFVEAARNYTEVLIGEIKTLRKRVLELIQSNNSEVQKRQDLQTELAELKKILRNETE
ncbi:MAG: hypothetical protein LBO73_00700 [Holosporaceae bacterium]|jgi:hypothetical protein|nr:hypothetical protein [Holosporaceae bacterium]